MSVVKWTEIDEPLLETDGLIDTLLDKICILDILDRYEVEYSICRTGEFSHRAKCPFPLHAFGDERTASFFASEDQNKFYCFGCNSGGSAIDFVILYEGKPFYEVAKSLARSMGITADDLDGDNIVKKERRDPEHKISTHVFRTGVQIREYLNSIKGKQEYNKLCEWADKRFVTLDKYLELGDDDWKVAKAYHDKVVNYLKSKL
jgi:hypothetical protein